MNWPGVKPPAVSSRIVIFASTAPRDAALSCLHNALLPQSRPPELGRRDEYCGYGTIEIVCP